MSKTLSEYDQDTGVSVTLNPVAQYVAALTDMRKAASLLGVTIPTVRRMRRDGRLKAIPLGCRCVRFSKGDITRILEARNEKASRVAAQLAE